MLSRHFLSYFPLILLTVLNGVSTQNSLSLSISSKSLTIIIGEAESFSITQTNGSSESAVLVSLVENYQNLVEVNPKQFSIPPRTSNFEQIISLLGKHPGHVEIDAQLTPNSTTNNDNLFIKVLVARSSTIITVSFIVGWIYFVAWSVSFYPQFWMNFKRKSVIGLNFDFISLNLLGHTLYAVFNSLLYWNSNIQAEYFNRFPKSVNPVELNDVFFSIHASTITLLTVIQCFIYQRDAQRVSNVARSIITFYFIIIIVVIVLASIDVVHWLDFLNTCSYIKLSITLIKYVPQAIMNYRRKSTIGWSIGNIILDFTGGFFSMMQITLNSYNYDDWVSIFGDPTKFGLGLFSILFDILFIIQHYALYRNLQPYEPIPETGSDELDESDQSIIAE